MSRMESITLLCLAGMALFTASQVRRRFQALQPPLAQSLPPIYSPERVIGTAKDFRGEPGSPYTLVEFGDYQCPACAELEKSLPTVLARYRGKLKLQFRNLPIPSHPKAQERALLAETAREYGRFWAAHDRLYAAGKAEASNGFVGLVQQEEMAEGSFRSSARKRMEQDKAIVADLRINYTPALFLCCPDKHVYWLSGLSQVEQVLSLQTPPL